MVDFYNFFFRDSMFIKCMIASLSLIILKFPKLSHSGHHTALDSHLSLAYPRHSPCDVTPGSEAFRDDSTTFKKRKRVDLVFLCIPCLLASLGVSLPSSSSPSISNLGHVCISLHESQRGGCTYRQSSLWSEPCLKKAVLASLVFFTFFYAILA